MNDYLKWNKQTISDFSSQNVSALYNQGYVFTRIAKGVMHQTRSLRIDLSKFDLTSENRRILRKTDSIRYTLYAIPYLNYNWHIAKLAKDFYDTKFGPGVFSANKIKKLLTDESKSNFNTLITYFVIPSDSSVISSGVTTSQRGHGVERSVGVVAPGSSNRPKRYHATDLSTPDAEFIPTNVGTQDDKKAGNTIGYAICYENDEILHYSYPFYDMSIVKGHMSNVGLGMMLNAILYAKQHGLRYFYLGSAQRPGHVYKLQFAGLEWFDGKEWQKNTNDLKTILV